MTISLLTLVCVLPRIHNGDRVLFGILLCFRPLAGSNSSHKRIGVALGSVDHSIHCDPRGAKETKSYRILLFRSGRGIPNLQSSVYTW